MRCGLSVCMRVGYSMGMNQSTDLHEIRHECSLYTWFAHRLLFISIIYIISKWWPLYRRHFTFVQQFPPWNEHYGKTEKISNF